MNSIQELRILLISIGLMAATGYSMHLHSVGHASFGPAAFWSAVMLGCWLAGEAVERLLRLGNSSVPAKALTGGVALGVAGTLVRLVVPWRLSAIIVALLVLAALVVTKRSGGRPRRAESPAAAWYSVAALFVGALAAVLWTWHLQPQVLATDEGLIYRPFREYLCLANMAGQLAVEGTPIRFGRLAFSGEPFSLYHYASFCLPVLASECTGTPLWQEMEAVWHPLSIVWLGWGAFTLGQTFAGPRGGFWATLAVVALPDLWFWPGAPQVTMLSFHRYIEGSPGLAYGCGAAALAIAVTLRGWRHGDVRQVAAGFALVLATFWFKFNAFLPAFGLFGLGLILVGRRVPPRMRWSGLALWGMMAALGVVGMVFSDQAPTLLPGGDAGKSLFQAIEESGVVPTGWMQHLANLPGLAGFSRRLLWFAVVIYGPLWVPFAAGVWLQRRNFWQPARGAWFPLVVLTINLVSAFGTSQNRNGDPFEMNHRQFGWAYTAVACWSAAQISKILPGGLSSKALVDGGCGALLVGWMIWIAGHANLPTDRLPVADGLIDCCRFLRVAARPADVVADSDADPYWLLAAQTQRRVLVCYPPDEAFNGWTRMRQLIRERREEIQQVLTLNTNEQLRSWADRLGVRWFVVLPDAQPTWPREVLDFPTFRAGGCRVYDFELLPELPNSIRPALRTTADRQRSDAAGVR